MVAKLGNARDGRGINSYEQHCVISQIIIIYSLAPSQASGWQLQAGPSIIHVTISW